MVQATRPVTTRPKYPYAFDCTSHLKGLSLDDPLKSGAYGDVHKCSLDGVPVAIKVLSRRYFFNIAEIAEKEYEVWHRLKHPNVLQLEAICYVTPESTVPSFVTRWQRNGNIKEYAGANEHADFLRLIEDIAHGVTYLHDNNIIHGDLRAVNVLVSDECRALVTDFGISKLVEGDEISVSGACQGNYRWMAPEFFKDGPYNIPANGAKRSKASDVWMYAVLIQEIFSGTSPFKGHTPHTAARFLGQGMLPEFHPPQHDSWKKFETALREIWTRCLVSDPAERPTIASVLENIRALRRQFGSSDSPPTTDNSSSASYSCNSIDSDDTTIKITGTLTAMNLSSAPGPSDEGSSSDNARASRGFTSPKLESASNGANDSSTARERPSPQPGIPPKTFQTRQTVSSLICPIVELNNYIARRGLGHRVTQNCFASGSIEERTWNWVIKLDGKEIATGSGWRKTDAKREASTKALAILCGKHLNASPKGGADSSGVTESGTFRWIGEDHIPTWIYTLRVNGRVIEGRGSNKMDAKQNARLQLALS